MEKKNEGMILTLVLEFAGYHLLQGLSSASIVIPISQKAILRFSRVEGSAQASRLVQDAEPDLSDLKVKLCFPLLSIIIT